MSNLRLVDTNDNNTENMVGDDQLVEYLEQLAEEARKGKLSGVAVALCYSNDSIGTGWAIGPEIFVGNMIGAATLLHKRILEHFDPSEE